MAHHAVDERHELADTLAALGPAAPTLCEGWTTTDLAAHLVLRERSAAELLTRVPVGPVRAAGRRTVERYTARTPYPAVVDAVRGGPPPWSPFRVPVLREAADLLEYVVHHEDARRGGTARDTAPRVLPVGRLEAVWARLTPFSRLLLRRLPVGLTLVWPDAPGGPRRATPRSGPAGVTATGDPVELALLAFGRQGASRADLVGPPASVETVRSARLGV